MHRSFPLFLQITRVCPANQLDKSTLKRIFEAVGLNLPARLLVTALRGADDCSLPPHQLLSLAAALLAALSTDPDMAAHPQLLATVPVLLGLLVEGPGSPRQRGREGNGEPEREKPSSEGVSGEKTRADAEGRQEPDEALAADCFQVLTAVCTLPKGPEQLLSRGAVPALCQLVEQNQPVSRRPALALLSRLLSSTTKDKIWRKHGAELLPLFLLLSTEFCGAGHPDRLDACVQLVHFLPPSGLDAESVELKRAAACVWAALRPLVQSKLSPRQIGPVLVLSACLLDLFGWELVGPPKFCCLLVNRACVEVRMGLEEPPGHQPGPEVQHTLTGTALKMSF